ncbi:unnamed protein product [Mycena citricolor]|uniref:Uncharacterized protein n=1 Tax=Mycena citricolor TaxID=2018698 RepID=A0AAD2HRA4_9AGAR|nr:unnamed protein product [Mycena citricolor]
MSNLLGTGQPPSFYPYQTVFPDNFANSHGIAQETDLSNPVHSVSPAELALPLDIRIERKCSVRTCLNVIEPPTHPDEAPRKMCVPCREKHRSYASTKRARRKAEKNLACGVIPHATGPADVIDGGVPPDPSTWEEHLPAAPPSSACISTAALSAPSASADGHWPIDQVLYAQSQASLHSTLAGALTLQSTADSSGQSPSSSHLPVVPGSSEGAQAGNPAGSNPVRANPTVYPDHVVSVGPPGVKLNAALLEGDSRYCSVKGCRAVIHESLADYPYKMCRLCRDRYRLYGIKKRAKDKATRVTQDKVLDNLRDMEDLRRDAAGLPPLSECPDELQAWEASIIEEQRPTGPTHQALVRGPVPMSMPPLDERYSHQGPVTHTRMCSVSHCHEILPSEYRYKRCEPHRLQNRWHSRIKRGREKIDKGFMLPDGTVLVEPGPVKVADLAYSLQAKTSDEATPSESESEIDPELCATTMKSNFQLPDREFCLEDGCLNPLPPGTPRKSCESCRAAQRNSEKEGVAPAPELASSAVASDNALTFVVALPTPDPPVEDASPTAIASDSASERSPSVSEQSPAPPVDGHSGLQPTVVSVVSKPKKPRKSRKATQPSEEVEQTPSHSAVHPSVAPTGIVPIPYPTSPYPYYMPPGYYNYSSGHPPPPAYMPPDKARTVVSYAYYPWPPGYPPAGSGPYAYYPPIPHPPTMNQYPQNHASTSAEQPAAKKARTDAETPDAVPEPQVGSAEPSVSQRICAGKTCHRSLSAAVAGNFCERCRARVKRRQASAKQRLRLEPKKSILSTRISS